MSKWIYISEAEFNRLRAEQGLPPIDLKRDEIGLLTDEPDDLGEDDEED